MCLRPRGLRAFALTLAMVALAEAAATGGRDTARELDALPEPRFADPPRAAAASAVGIAGSGVAVTFCAAAVTEV